jgi:NADPH:quinone reductase-like Zn-dependent oxidoreductase
MKAIVHTAYGPPEELQLREVENPVPGDEQVLIKVRATSVTSSDCNMRNLTFVPKLLALPMRLQFGWSTPKIAILGVDVAGEVEAVGKDVQRFQVGDQVFGTTEPSLGAYAQYVCLPGDAVLAVRPADVTWEEAACIPLAGVTALNFLRDLAKVQAGQHILINGASGAIGTFAVQLAKHFGAQVTGVCSARNVELVRSLGADAVIDYTVEDFAQAGQAYDVIFDAVSKSSFPRCKGSLKDGGLYMATLPTASVLWHMMWTSAVGSRKVKMTTSTPKVEDLAFLRELAEAGELKVVIDRTYPLEQMVDAFSHVETGHKTGNVAISVSHD